MVDQEGAVSAPSKTSKIMARTLKRTQTESITLPSGTTAGTRLSYRVTMDTEFSRVSGIAVYLVSGSFPIPARLQVRDDRGIYQDSTYLADYMLNNNALGYLHDEFRRKKVDYKAKGNTLIFDFDILTTLGADQVLDVVFDLEDPVG